MFFWLCIFHETSLVGSRSGTAAGEGSENPGIAKGVGFYLFKAIYCTFLWLLMTSSYIYLRVQSDGDPSYDALEDSTHYKLISGANNVASAVYLGWITYHGLNAVANAKKLPGAVVFVFSFSVLMIILIMVCVAIGATYPLPSASYEFLLFYGLTNAYVWCLSFAYAPLNASSTSLTESSSMVEIGPLAASAV